MKVKYPENLKEIPLRNFQAWNKVANSTNDNELLAHKFIEIFLGLNLEDVRRIKFSDVSFFIAEVTEVLKKKPQFTQRFTFEGVEFGFIPDLENISWGEYIDIESNLVDVENYHKAMAVMYRPITRTHYDTYEIMEYKGDTEFHDLMKLIPLEYALGANVFFCDLEMQLLNHTLNYLGEMTKQMKITKEEETAIRNQVNSLNNGGGTIAFTESLKGTLENLIA